MNSQDYVNVVIRVKEYKKCPNHLLNAVRFDLRLTLI